MAGKKKKPARAVVVTTEFRGVFFGYVIDESKAPEKITLTNARNCVYWTEQTRGVLGLAAKGPSTGCRIGPQVPELTLWKLTSITECSEVAVDAWEQEPWK